MKALLTLAAVLFIIGTIQFLCGDPTGLKTAASSMIPSFLGMIVLICKL